MTETPLRKQPTWDDGARKTRVFQLWDYAPTHRTLLYRSPAQDERDANIDLRFVGVRSIAAASSIEIPAMQQVRRIPLGAEHGVEIWKFEMSDTNSVIAEDYYFDQNYKDIFDALPGASSDRAISSDRFEKSAISALRLALPSWTAVEPPSAPAGLDLIMSEGAKVMFVEIRRTEATPPRRAIRQIVMKIASALSRNDLKDARLLVVVGGQSPDFIEELNRHLFSALGSHASSIDWEPSRTPADLTRAVEKLFATP